MIKASIIIQARMSSTRFPGKVLRMVSGKPLIGHMIERLKHCKNVDQIIIATSEEKSNDSLCNYLSEIGMKSFRGDEEDVLSRYYFAAQTLNSKYIVRLTGDCPLIDPIQVDRFIKEISQEKADYVHSGPSFAEGLDTEVFTFKALREAHFGAIKSSEREHCTQYFHNNNENYNIITIDNNVDDSKYRITVDEKEDFVVVKSIFESLYSEEKPLFGISEIKKYLNENPDIFAINSSIIRNEGLIKSLKKEADSKNF